MSCDCTPFVYIANSSVSGIPATNGSIPLGSVVRQHTNCAGPNCYLDGEGIVCKGKGIAFSVEGHITLAQVDTSSETPPVIGVSLLQNGATVQGSSVSAASPGRVTLPISSVIRNGDSSSVITLLNTGVEVNLINLAIQVKPI